MKQVAEFNLLPALEDYTHGFTINFTLPDLMTYGAWIGQRVKAWDMQNIADLRVLLEEAHDVQRFLEHLGMSFSLDEIGVDMATIPSYPVPDALYQYTIWAVDSRGNALIGDDFQIVKIETLLGK